MGPDAQVLHCPPDAVYCAFQSCQHYLLCIRSIVRQIATGPVFSTKSPKKGPAEFQNSAPNSVDKRPGKRQRLWSARNARKTGPHHLRKIAVKQTQNARIQRRYDPSVTASGSGRSDKGNSRRHCAHAASTSLSAAPVPRKTSM